MKGGNTNAKKVCDTPPTSPLNIPNAGTKLAALAATKPRTVHTAMWRVYRLVVMDKDDDDDDEHFAPNFSNQLDCCRCRSEKRTCSAISILGLMTTGYVNSRSIHNSSWTAETNTDPFTFKRTICSVVSPNIMYPTTLNDPDNNAQTLKVRSTTLSKFCGCVILDSIGKIKKWIKNKYPIDPKANAIVPHDRPNATHPSPKDRI
mmetsp:Transcript_54779/g.133010  ORF Transcript_54779/g.133010 Transcript_54779/m.133010 type:complete len:204 (+) Transcript_54779:840-1451(+)